MEHKIRQWVGMKSSKMLFFSSERKIKRKEKFKACTLTIALYKEIITIHLKYYIVKKGIIIYVLLFIYFLFIFWGDVITSLGHQ